MTPATCTASGTGKTCASAACCRPRPLLSIISAWGVACGLRHIYFPSELPPCVHLNGEVDWHYSEEEEEHEAMLV